MNNRKYQLLMADVARLVKGAGPNVAPVQSLVCEYEGLSCCIEDGARVGMHDRLVLLLEVKGLDGHPEEALKLNSNFALTGEGYIALHNGTFFYVRTLSMPDYAQQLLEVMSGCVNIVRELHKEIAQHVAH